MAKNLNVPLQRPQTRLPGDLERKRGPGTLRKQGDTVGPSIERPRINAAAQSQRSNAAERTSTTSDGLGENARTISRDELFPDYEDTYGFDLPTDEPEDSQ